jgi:integrase
VSIGEGLAQARRQAGLTVTQVSERTCIRETIILGIAHDDYSACGGDFYTRGHIRAIAKAVGTDPMPLITTALNDQVTFLHPCKGVKTPPIPKRPHRIITPEQFDDLYAALSSETIKVLVETGVESGLRWGELTELRPGNLDFRTGVLTQCR